MPNARKPFPIKLAIGSVLLLVSIWLVGNTFTALMRGKAHEELFAAPGTYKVDIVEPGRYYLWHHYKTLFQGEPVSRNRKLPSSFQFSVQDGSGAELELTLADDKAWSIGNHAKVSIAFVELKGGDAIEINVQNAGNASAVLSFAKADMKKDLWTAFGGLPIALGAAILGLPLVLWGLLSSSRS